MQLSGFLGCLQIRLFTEPILFSLCIVLNKKRTILFNTACKLNKIGVFAGAVLRRVFKIDIKDKTVFGGILSCLKCAAKERKH